MISIHVVVKARKEGNKNCVCDLELDKATQIGAILNVIFGVATLS